MSSSPLWSCAVKNEVHVICDFRSGSFGPPFFRGENGSSVNSTNHETQTQTSAAAVLPPPSESLVPSISSTNSYACATSLFLIGKIFINVHILPNPPRIRILFILGFYGLGLFMRHKLFPFRISWRPHNDQFSAMWPFDSSTLVRSHQFRLLLARLFGSIISKFLPLQLPPHPMGPWSMSGRTHGVTVQSDLLRNTPTLTGWPKIIDEEHMSLT